MKLNILSLPSNKMISQIIHGISWSFIIKIIALSFGFISNIFLARILGVSSFGSYSFAITITEILTMLAVLGFPILIVREVSKYTTSSNWTLLNGLFKRSFQLAIGFALFITVFSCILLVIIKSRPYSEMVFAVLLALPLVILNTGVQLQSAFLQGFKFIVASQIPSQIIQRCGFLLIVGSIFFYNHDILSLSYVIEIQIIMALVALTYCYFLLKQKKPEQLTTSKCEFKTSYWINSALTFLFINSVFLINKQTDILMIGALLEPRDVGIYKAVVQGADLIVIILTVVTMVMQPIVSNLYTLGDMVKLQNFVTLSSRIITFICTPIFLFLLFFGDLFLILFGDEFIIGKESLSILIVGQFANAIFGTVGVILSMTGHEKDTLKGIAIAAIANIILNASLIPLYGIKGAAFSTTISIFIWNIILAFKVAQRTGLHTTALGVLPWNK